MKNRLVLTFISLLILVGCGRQDDSLKVRPHPSHEGRYICQFRVMSTSGAIMVAADDAETARQFIKPALNRIREVDRLMSSYRDNSDVSRLNEMGHSEKVKVSPQTIEVLLHAKKLHRMTDGAFDATYAPLKSLWQKAVDQEETPSQSAIRKTLSRVSSKDLHTSKTTAWFSKSGMEIDLGGIAKGYAIDEGIRALRSAGAEHGLIDLGGDMRVLGARADGEKWKIKIRDPRPGEHAPLMLQMADAAVATSGDYNRYFHIGDRQYSHIIDPRTGRPAKAILSVTVTAPDATLADGLATALSIMDTRSALELVNAQPEVECLLMERNGNDKPESIELSYSDGFLRELKDEL